MGHFDAIVGRRVLMYLPDAEKCLQILKSILKPEVYYVFKKVMLLTQVLDRSTIFTSISNSMDLGKQWSKKVAIFISVKIYIICLIGMECML